MDKEPANLILEHLKGIRADINNLKDDMGEVKAVQQQHTHILQELAGSLVQHSELLVQIHERLSKLETA